MRALVLVGVVLGASPAFADGVMDEPNRPVISKDGMAILIPYRDDDSAIPSPNEDIYVYSRTGKLTKTVAMASREKLVTELHPHPMDEPDEKKQDGPLEHRVYVGVRVDLSPNGTLTVKPDGKPAIKRKGGWRTEPTAAQKAAIAKEADKDMMSDNACFHAAMIDRVYLDTALRAAVVLIRFRGNDSCWEPAHDYAVVTW